jgi:peptidoglycan/xylan/chitin deacetylase (PgdA/CDA1 family)
MIRSGIDRYAGSVRSVKVTESLFALTFDDGPHPANTIAILAVLAERGIHATFFMVADRAIAAPGVVAEVVHGGHEIGLHGRTHCDLTRVSSKRMWDEIRGGKHRLEHVVGRPVRWFRPPYGTQNLRSFVGARAAGLEVIGWTASPRDFLALGLDQHREVAERELAPGGILLLHDGPPSVPAYRTELAHAVLDDAARRGLRPTTVGDLMLNGDPHRERWFTTRAPAIIAELGPLYLRPETTPSSAATVTTWVASNQRTFTPPSS